MKVNLDIEITKLVEAIMEVALNIPEGASVESRLVFASMEFQRCFPGLIIERSNNSIVVRVRP